MLVSIWQDLSPRADAANEAPAPRKKRRRGATALEYCVCASMIVVAAILGIQHVGSVAKGLLGNAATATNFSGS
jgi:Flp pilus assembly pilin Flp